MFEDHDVRATIQSTVVRAELRAGRQPISASPGVQVMMWWCPQRNGI